jgi:hypothetical protein
MWESSCRAWPGLGDGLQYGAAQGKGAAGLYALVEACRFADIDETDRFLAAVEACSFEKHFAAGPGVWR